VQHPCPCTFAQPPTFGRCDGVLAWHVRDGRFGDVVLDGLNVMAVGGFDGNIWTGARPPSASSSTAAATIASARRCRRSSAAGPEAGRPSLRRTSPSSAASSSRRSSSKSPATSPTGAPPFPQGRGARRGVDRADHAAGAARPNPQPAGRRDGPERHRHLGVSKADEVDVFGFKWSHVGQSSKHIPFDWTGPG